jgi:hypothetical protein
MIRALTITTAVAALAVPATPALAGTSSFSSEPTAGGGRPGSAHVANSLGPDSDADGMPDAYEMEKGTNPLRADSDLDGLTDGFELSLGSNPLKASTVKAKSRSLSIRFSWRTPNPRRQQEFQLIQAQLAEAG